VLAVAVRFRRGDEWQTRSLIGPGRRRLEAHVNLRGPNRLWSRAAGLSQLLGCRGRLWISRPAIVGTWPRPWAAGAFPRGLRAER